LANIPFRILYGIPSNIPDTLDRGESWGKLANFLSTRIKKGHPCQHPLTETAFLYSTTPAVQPQASPRNISIKELYSLLPQTPLPVNKKQSIRFCNTGGYQMRRTAVVFDQSKGKNQPVG
jgi:hypothetical protein